MRKTEERYSLLPILLAVSTSAMLVANIVAGKQFAVFGIALPCAVLIFPITYIISDIFSEVYGYKWSRRSAWVAFGMNIFAVSMFQITLLLPAVPWFENQAAFEIVLGNTPRILFASLFSFMLGDWVNDIVFRQMKRADAGNKRFALRSIISSLCGHFTDSLIFVPIAFIGAMPMSQMLIMIMIQPTTKFILEVVLLPLTKMCVELAKRYEKTI